MSLNTSALSEISAITESSTPQVRKRPLRTYSRRSAETFNPKSKVQNDAPRVDTKANPRAKSETTSTPSPKKEDQEKQSRGSILAYFKPVPLRTEKITSKRQSEGIERLDTPPSSPPSLPSTRKRRRLTTRPQYLYDDQFAKDTYEQDTEENNKEAKTFTPTCKRSPSVESTIVVALDEVPANVVSASRLSAATSTKSGSGGSRPPQRKRSAREMTQTTLNLSIHKEPGFTICSVCDLLYNPLNEKDRKEHKRLHAAFLRNKPQSSSVELP
jgi:hypothetical protein